MFRGVKKYLLSSTAYSRDDGTYTWIRVFTGADLNIEDFVKLGGLPACNVSVDTLNISVNNNNNSNNVITREISVTS